MTSTPAALDGELVAMAAWPWSSGSLAAQEHTGELGGGAAAT